jgi:hypothetical protein
MTYYRRPYPVRPKYALLCGEDTFAAAILKIARGSFRRHPHRRERVQALGNGCELNRVRSRNIGRTGGEQFFVCRYPPKGRTAEYETRPCVRGVSSQVMAFPGVEDHEK